MCMSSYVDGSLCIHIYTTNKVSNLLDFLFTPSVLVNSLIYVYSFLWNSHFCLFSKFILLVCLIGYVKNLLKPSV